VDPRDVADWDWRCTALHIRIAEGIVAGLIGVIVGGLVAAIVAAFARAVMR